METTTLEVRGDDICKGSTFVTGVPLPGVVFHGVLADAGSVSFGQRAPDHDACLALAILGTLAEQDPYSMAQYGDHFQVHKTWVPHFRAAKEWMALHLTVTPGKPPTRVIVLEMVSELTVGDTVIAECFTQNE